MSINETFEAVRAKQAEREHAVESAFRELAKRLADDEKVEPETVDHVLTVAGKTLEDLEQAVKSHLKRTRLHKVMDDNAPAEQEWRALVKEIQALNAEAEEQEKLYEAKRKELTARHDQAHRRMETAKQAREQLRQTGLQVVDTQFLKYRQIVKEAWGGATRAEAELKQEIAALEHQAGDLHATINGNQPGVMGGSKDRLEQAEEELAQVRPQIKAKREALAQQNKTVAHYKAQREQVEEQIIASA